MATTTCPKCEVLIEGSLAEITRHVKTCGKRRKATGIQTRETLKRVAPVVTELVFNRSPISQNKTTYSHWSAHHSDKKDWLQRLRPVAASLGGTYDFSSWRVTRLYGSRNREMDFANLVGGLKGFFDCLTELGVIVDDSPSHFKVEYLQIRALETATKLELLFYSFGKEDNHE